VKIFLLNNNGYHSIRQTQANFFGLPLVGCGPENGVSFPEMRKLAAAYGIKYFKCGRNSLLSKTLKKTLKSAGAVICEIVLDPAQAFAPRSSSKKLPDGRIVSRPLEDMAPFLSEEELKSNMITGGMK
jgi:acetolactate synthase-1/2/3 large subunit